MQGFFEYILKTSLNFQINSEERNYLMKKLLSIFTVLALLFSAISLISCSESELYSEGDGEFNVVCTTFIPFDIARNIGGDDATVTILQDSGADLHNYSPTTATLSALANADIFVYIGGESDEKWVGDAISACNNQKLITVCLMDCIDEPLHAELSCDWTTHEHGEHDEHDEHEHDEHEHHADEHIWTSPRNVISMTDAVKNAMCLASPEVSESFNNNAAKYALALAELDARYQSAVSDASIKYAVVADRFPFIYLFHDYNIGYIAAFSGCSTEVNASFKTQVGLIEAARSKGVKFILTIEGGDKSLAEAVAGECGCTVRSLDSMQSVKRSDIEGGATYLEIMEKNLEVLKEVLN